ncbi:MAG: Uma2 family endonuclease [Aggregatilineales bacterium]
MEAEITQKKLTVEDVLRLNTEHHWVEIVDGEIIKMSPVGFRHSYISNNGYDVLNPFVKTHKLGYVANDGLIYVLHVDPETGVRHTRVPDLSFFRKGKFPDFDFTKPVPGAPDLAIEIVSPSESDETTINKLRSYFAYGTEQVWVLFPESKFVYQYFDVDDVKIHTEDKTFTAETLFPGLEIKVADFFIEPDIK